MKLTVEQKNLHEALVRAAKATPSRPLIPVLAHVLLTASSEGLTLTATNCDVEATHPCEAVVNKTGSVLIPAESAVKIVSKMKKGSVITIDADDGYVKFTSGRTSATLQTLPPEDYPKMSDDDYECTFDIDTQALHDMFNRVAFAASTEETRYYLRGVYMHQSDAGGIVTVATDGHRLAKMETECNVLAFDGVIVPSEAIALITPPECDTVTVSVSSAKIKFSANGWTLVSKTIDGTYPDYSRIIPSTHKTLAKFDPADMINASAVAESVMDMKGSAIKLDVSSESIGVSGTSGANHAEDFLDCDMSGDTINIGVNGKYMHSIMSHIDGNAEMYLGGWMDPIRFCDSECEVWVAVVMPMRA